MWIAWLARLAWLVAVVWWARVLPAMLHLRRVPDLNAIAGNELAAALPSMTVIVPARNEEVAIARTLESLAMQDYPALRVIAVDDRSTDSTGALMDRAREQWPERIEVVHIHDLPDGWTGKVHAIATAARLAKSEWILFTDGDVFFEPLAIRRAMTQALRDDVVHFVTMPTLEIRSHGEAMMIAFFQTTWVWTSRLWKVPDVNAQHDVIGVGAFNLVRRDAYLNVGGFDAMPMEILEDMHLAREIKRARMKSQVAYGHGLVHVHWASGVRGLVRGLTKNMYAGMGFHSWLIAFACVTMLVTAIAPFAGIFWHATRIPAALSIAALVVTYRLFGRRSGVSTGYVVFAHVAAALMIYTLLRSIAVTLWQGGVTWRGTFYPLGELRKHSRTLW